MSFSSGITFFEILYIFLIVKKIIFSLHFEPRSVSLSFYATLMSHIRSVFSLSEQLRSLLIISKTSNRVRNNGLPEEVLVSELHDTSGLSKLPSGVKPLPHATCQLLQESTKGLLFHRCPPAGSHISD